jgi:formylmethanofuran dehydrogenase subunit C
VTDVVTLTMRDGVEESVELDGITPDRVGSLEESELAALPIRIGRRTAQVGDLFTVRGGRAVRMRIEGDLHRVDGLGAGAAGGEMLVEGDVGHRLAAGMRNGWIDVRGNAGHDAGVAMRGGALRIVGNAGDRLGAPVPGGSKGMTGGEIIINGDAGADAGARTRRGLIVVTGTVGSQAGRAMIAGTLVAFGRILGPAGRGSKRGSIVALGDIEVPETYRYACTYQPTYVRLLLTYLRRRYGISVEDAALNGAFERYCGDTGEVGKGEILRLVR